MPRFLNPFPQFLKLQNGALQPNSDGYLYFYVNGTSTLASIWTNSGMSVAADNPQRLDSEGRMSQNVFIDTDLYRIRLGDNNDATIWDKSDFSVADTSEVQSLITQLETLIQTVSQDLFSNNYVSNPAMQVDNIDTVGTPITLSTSYQDTVTGFASAVLSNVTAGTAKQSTTQVGESGYSLFYENVSCSSAGKPALRFRILSADAISLSNKDLTVQLVVQHDVGSAVNYVIATYVANAADNFAAVTSTGITSTTSVASGTATTISVTGAFGNVTNGLEVIVYAEPGQALTTKDFYWSDVGVYPSAIVMPFRVPTDVDSQLSQLDPATIATSSDLLALAERTYTSIVQVPVIDAKTTGTAASWTWPTGVTAVRVTGVGGGGAGGDGGSLTTDGSGGGGGAGGAFIVRIAKVDGLNTITYTVGGAGAASTVVYNSITYTASAGSAGGNSGGTQGGASGAGGGATNGDINIPGGKGNGGGGANAAGGSGGSSLLGNGGAGGASIVNGTNGSAGSVYGSGGGGGSSDAGGSSGGAGAAGIVIFEY